MILNEGDVMRDGDEWESPHTGQWLLIPPGWFGCKVAYDNSTTFGRFHIRVRRTNTSGAGEHISQQAKECHTAGQGE